MMAAAGADILANGPCVKMRITPAVMVVGRPRALARRRMLKPFVWVRRLTLCLCFSFALLGWKQNRWRAVEHELLGRVAAVTPASGASAFAVRDSAIAGQGVFATRALRAGENLGAALLWRADRWSPESTTLGGKVNHAPAERATCTVVERRAPSSSSGAAYDLVALRAVAAGEELTASYYATPFFVELPAPWWS